MGSDAEKLQKILDKLGIEDAADFLLPDSSLSGALSDPIESNKSKLILKQSPASESNNKIETEKSQDENTSTDQKDELDRNSSLPTGDSVLIRLLELVSEYEDLANGDFRSELIEAFSDLSRATFNSTRTFGPDSFDMRPYEACKTVEVANDGTVQLHNQLHRQSLPESTKPKTQGARSRKIRKNLESTSEDSNDSKVEKIELPSLSDSCASKGRTTALSSGSSNGASLTETKPKLRDPIYQFGGLVPYQLRHAQTHFSNALAHSLKLVNLRFEIEVLISKVNETK